MQQDKKKVGFWFWFLLFDLISSYFVVFVPGYPPLIFKIDQ